MATTAAHFAAPPRRRLAMAMAAVRSRQSLDEAAGWLAPTGGAHLRSGAEMAALFSLYPEAVSGAADLGRECAFDLKLIAPKLPPFDVPAGHTEASWLRELTMVGALERYGPPEGAPKAYKQLEHELAIIEGLNFPGYFLVVHDIVSFCKNNDILCQGRGSAANSAVCYAIGITNVDPVRNKLLFERFLAPERDGPPDIDVDIESDRREEAIQHVYAKYGRTYAAQVANVITYRGKSSVRDMARALGFSQGQQDAWSKQVGRWGGIDKNADTDIPRPVLELAAQIEGYPRHLGIHSGGMVICDRPIADVCPVEWARMANRSVLQWDKDDCAAAGLVKFDLLGLGMLSALHYMMDLVAEHKGITVDLAQLDLSETAVYEMLQRADSVGVFQVESRAQMATLPRLKPRNFYDLVVEVALIRPGPIQGGSVHPYIRRRNKLEPVSYDHPSLEKALERTLGVPLFQEQLMQMAVDVAASRRPRPINCVGQWDRNAPPRRWNNCARGSIRACETYTASVTRLPTGSTKSCMHSLISVSRKAIHRVLPRWSSTPRGSNFIIPLRSAPDFCARSPWFLLAAVLGCRCAPARSAGTRCRHQCQPRACHRRGRWIRGSAGAGGSAQHRRCTRRENCRTARPRWTVHVVSRSDRACGTDYRTS